MVRERGLETDGAGRLALLLLVGAHQTSGGIVTFYIAPTSRPRLSICHMRLLLFFPPLPFAQPISSRTDSDDIVGSPLARESWWSPARRRPCQLAKGGYLLVISSRSNFGPIPHGQSRTGADDPGSFMVRGKKQMCAAYVLDLLARSQAVCLVCRSCAPGHCGGCEIKCGESKDSPGTKVSSAAFLSSHLDRVTVSGTS